VFDGLNNCQELLISLKKFCKHLSHGIYSIKKHHDYLNTVSQVANYSLMGIYSSSNNSYFIYPS
jgi:hypothetical protein